MIQTVLHQYVVVQSQLSSLDGDQVATVHPHPPSSSPAEQSLVRIRRTKVRMVSEKSSRRPRVEESQSSTIESLKRRDTDQAVMKLSKETTASARHGRDIDVYSDEEFAADQLTQTLHPVDSTQEEQIYSYRSAPKSAERPLLPKIPVSHIIIHVDCYHA